MVDSATVIGVPSGYRRDICLFLDLYIAGKLKLEELIPQRYGLVEINEGYQDLLTGEVAGGVIVF